MPDGMIECYFKQAERKSAAFLQFSELTRCSLQASAIRLTRYTGSHAIFLASNEERVPSKAKLYVRWSAAPIGLFIPQKKYLPKNSPFTKAEATGKYQQGLEKRLNLGSLRGDYFVEATPVKNLKSVVCLVHLEGSAIHYRYASQKHWPSSQSFTDNAVQLALPFEHDLQGR